MTEIKDDVADEILRQGELRLQAQIELATSADQRSITFLGISGGAAIALAAASAAIFTAEKPNVSLAVAFLAGSVMLFLSALLAGFATRPLSFHVPGTRASLLTASASSRLADIKLMLADRYEERVKFNESILARNGRHMLRALLAAPLSVPVAIGAYLIGRVMCP